MSARSIAAFSLAVLFAVALATDARAEEKKPASPRGQAQTQIDGKWIEIDYGRPIKRQRADLFGSGKDYGEKVNGGAPVWRAGANQTTKLHTDAPLTIAGKKLPAGDYDLFIDLKATGWTLILSTQEAAKNYDPKEKKALWGSYNYDPKFDVLQAPMSLTTSAHSVDQLTIRFLDVTAKGGTLEVAWDTQVATVDFTLGG